MNNTDSLRKIIGDICEDISAEINSDTFEKTVHQKEALNRRLEHLRVLQVIPIEQIIEHSTADAIEPANKLKDLMRLRSLDVSANVASDENLGALADVDTSEPGTKVMLGMVYSVIIEPYYGNVGNYSSDVSLAFVELIHLADKTNQRELVSLALESSTPVTLLLPALRLLYSVGICLTKSTPPFDMDDLVTSAILTYLRGVATYTPNDDDQPEFLSEELGWGVIFLARHYQSAAGIAWLSGKRNPGYAKYIRALLLSLRGIYYDKMNPISLPGRRAK